MQELEDTKGTYKAQCEKNQELLDKNEALEKKIMEYEADVWRKS